MQPAISTNNPLATIIPLTFIICLGIIKELVVEISRYFGDQHVNKSKYTIITGVKPSAVAGEDSYERNEIRFEDIKVGQIIELQDG